MTGSHSLVTRPAPPAVFCPLAPRISPHSGSAEAAARDWATARGLATTGLAGLMARTYPHASLADLTLATEWLITVFALDDHLESMLPQAVDAVTADVLSILDGAPVAGPVAAALADVWARTRGRLGPAWRARFVEHVRQYLAGCRWEAANRCTGRVPGVGEYRTMRRHTAATSVFFDLIEVFHGCRLPARALRTPAFTLMRGHAADAVAWYNDLASWPKELVRGDCHNLVLVLHERRRLSLDDAVTVATAHHDRAVRRFLAARAQLPAWLRGHPAVAAASRDLGHWISGNVDWSRGTCRYA